MLIIRKIKNILNKYKLRKIGSIGVRSYVNYKSINHLPNIFIGDYVKSGKNCLFYTTVNSNIHIGDGTIIAPNVTILTSNHNYDSNNLLALPFDNINVVSDVIIGKGVWIGQNVVILPGVKVGNGAVIGACTVVTKDIPDGAIVVGNPGKIIKFRNQKILNELLEKNLFYHSDNWSKKEKKFEKK